jgi:hypothetical protein
MNLAQSKVLLEKIITLYKSMSVDEKNISPIERDLMLSYTRQLYETFLHDTPSVSTPKQPIAEPVAPPKVEPPKVETQRYVPPPPPPPTYVEPSTPPKQVAEPPRPVMEPPRPPVAETPHSIVEPPKPAPSSPPMERVKHAPEMGNIPPEIDALFEENISKELSDKLSNMPIGDLTKAFGLNDRLLTQNELFGGSKVVFDQAIRDLNAMPSFDAAKGVLVSLAVQYNWVSNEDRKRQAKTFIKMIRRRFK